MNKKIVLLFIAFFVIILLILEVIGSYKLQNSNLTTNLSVNSINSTQINYNLNLSYVNSLIQNLSYSNRINFQNCTSLNKFAKYTQYNSSNFTVFENAEWSGYYKQSCEGISNCGMEQWTVSVSYPNQTSASIRIMEGGFTFNNTTSSHRWAIELSNSYGWNLSFLGGNLSQIYYGTYIENISGNITEHMNGFKNLVLAMSNSCIQ